MNSYLRRQVYCLGILVPMALVSSVPTQAHAQRIVRVNSPEIYFLKVQSDDGIRPGSQLELTVEATPRAQVTVRLGAVNSTIALREVSPGIYTGPYTVRRADRLREDAKAVVTASSEGRNVTGSFNLMNEQEARERRPEVTASGPAVPPPWQVAPPQIERFVVLPINKVEPGAELRFRLNGPPGAIVSFDIPGLARNIPMQETRIGHYEGAYTIRRDDNMVPTGPVVATVRVGASVATANLAGPLIVDNTPPAIVNLSPRAGGVVTEGNVIVSAAFDDSGGTGVDPRTVKIVIGSTDVTAQSQITAQSFSFRGTLPAGHYIVDVSAKDRVGNPAHQAWTFDVAAVKQSSIQPPSLQITSHGNNAGIDTNVTQLRGRTAPGSMVQIAVSAIPPFNLGRGQIAFPVMTETTRADAQGNFSFNFAPSGIAAVPGMRYDVTVTSSRQDMAPMETKLVLFQRG